MSAFAVMVLSGPGIGCIAAGWIEQAPRLGWRWIQWIHVMYVCRSLGFPLILGLIPPVPTSHTRSWLGVFVIGVPICMKETRSGVLLTRLAKRLRKKTGNPHYRARIEDERASLRTLIYISCTRPICKHELVSN